MNFARRAALTTAAVAALALGAIGAQPISAQPMNERPSPSACGDVSQQEHSSKMR